MTKPPCTGGKHNSIICFDPIPICHPQPSYQDKKQLPTYLVFAIRFQFNKLSLTKIKPEKLAEKKTFLRAIEVVYIFMEANMN